MMRNLKIEPLNKGTYNKLDPELIPKRAASDSVNWRTFDDHIEVALGRRLVGERETGSGGNKGLHVGYTSLGDPVVYRKISDKVQAYNWDTKVWEDAITGLTPKERMNFINYTSLAGNFLICISQDGIWKIPHANPLSSIDMYEEAKNYKGNAFIDQGRMVLWGVEKDKTGLYVSHIDNQNYTTVDSESLGSTTAALTYSGTLAFKGSNPKATCFGFNVAHTSENFRDDFSGNLIGSNGGTGKINYATGEWTLTFASTPDSGTMTGSYQWENSNDKGVTDFSYSSPRIAAEGDVFRQDEGGDEIIACEIIEGGYYSFKRRTVYELRLSADDTTGTNRVYRKNIGIESPDALVSTGNGLYFVNTANPQEPQLVILRRNIAGDNIIPENVIPQFDLSPFDWSECSMHTHEERIIFTGKKKGSIRNDRMFEYSPVQKSVDTLRFFANSMITVEGRLYIGDSVSDNVFEMFVAFSDDKRQIQNFWEGAEQTYRTDDLKKVKRMRFKGTISAGIKIKVYKSEDNAKYTQIGTILGLGSHVDRSGAIMVGTSPVGMNEVGGGGEGIKAYPYYIEFKINTKKFDKKKIRFEAEGFGYASVRMIEDRDIRLFKSRMPAKYRKKDNVSIDGEILDIDDPVTH